jgi:hydroxymethylpyrimidine/phosphomethylpyrimidine kinase
MSARPHVLSVHAVDTAGHEGVLADAAVLFELDCRPISIVTAIVATGAAFEGVSPALLAQQFEAVRIIGRPAAARTGILRDAAQVELVAGLLRDSGIDPIVVSPVMRIGGVRVLDGETLDAMRRFLYPLARILVVRAADVPLISDAVAENVEGLTAAAHTLRAEGARSVLVAGVTSKGRVLDLLDEEGRVMVLDASRITAPHLAGLAGAHVTALTAHLARGLPLSNAVTAAQRYVALRLQRGR